MNFIERWLGLAPDGGSGFAEVAILTAVLTATLAAVLWRGWRVVRASPHAMRS
jgi:hypothetical protein